jgi:hypothetical protein
MLLISGLKQIQPFHRLGADKKAEMQQYRYFVA